MIPLGNWIVIWRDGVIAATNVGEGESLGRGQGCVALCYLLSCLVFSG